MARAAYEASLEYYPNLRPFVLSRAGGPGIQRYAQTWTGDNTTSWHTLRYNIPMGLGMGLSGMPNVGHDIGGFGGPSPDPELFVRWVQNGIFHPRFTIHSWNSDGTVNEPWMHPSVLPIVREMIQFRYRLIPYLYSLMSEAHHTGHPIIRPLVYHFPDDPQCHTESFDFLLGSHLLVASVLEPDARTRRVYLPHGTWWCNFYSGEWYEGGQTIEVDAPLERIPLFVADGGIIPMGEVMRYIGEQVEDIRDIYVFARGEANFTLIEDDGVSLMYYAGGYTALQLSLVQEGDELVASADVQHNGYPLPYRDVTFIVATDQARSVRGATLTQGRWRLVVPVS
jgi:alpha-glucosidase